MSSISPGSRFPLKPPCQECYCLSGTTHKGLGPIFSMYRNCLTFGLTAGSRSTLALFVEKLGGGFLRHFEHCKEEDLQCSDGAVGRSLFVRKWFIGLDCFWASRNFSENKPTVSQAEQRYGRIQQQSFLRLPHVHHCEPKMLLQHDKTAYTAADSLGRLLFGSEHYFEHLCVIGR